MTRRVRLSGALVALLALSLYFAEGVWASLCPPEMQMAGAGHASAHAADEHEVGHAYHASRAHDAHAEHDARHEHDASHDVPCSAAEPDAAPADAEPPAPTRTDAPACPFGPAGANGSCVAVSLPASTTSMAPFFAAGAATCVSGDLAADLLLPATLFHPPKA